MAALQPSEALTGSADHCRRNCTAEQTALSVGHNAAPSDEPDILVGLDAIDNDSRAGIADEPGNTAQQRMQQAHKRALTEVWERRSADVSNRAVSMEQGKERSLLTFCTPLSSRARCIGRL